MNVFEVKRELFDNKGKLMLIERETLLKHLLPQKLRKLLCGSSKEFIECRIVRINSNYCCTNDSIDVEFINFPNPLSVYRCFWLQTFLIVNMFNNGKLKYKDQVINNNQEENIMENFKIVKIRFFNGNGGIYPYALIDDIDIKDGDLVAVKPAHHPRALAKVVSVVDNPTNKDIEFASEGREIIGKVDTSVYDERKRKRNRVVELEKLMDEIVRENGKLVFYGAVAQNNPAMAELLAEYKSLL